MSVEKEKYNEKIRERLMDLLSEKNVSDKDLESYLHIGKGMISHWRYQKTNSFLHYVIPLCEYLDVSPNFLFFGVSQTEDPVELSPGEKDIIRMYRMVDDDKRKFIKEGLRIFTEM